jgi:hypothetical protein
MAMEPTALQRHVGFFDPEGTGVITMRQTRDGMRRLGVSWLWRVILPPIINGFLGYLTQKKVSFVVDIGRIAQGKHPFDSGVFDATGAQDPVAMQALFAKGVAADPVTKAANSNARAVANPDSAGPELLTADEMHAVITARGNRLPAMGKVAGALGHWFSGREVQLFFCVAADATKIVGGRPVPAVTRATLQSFYDGTLLPELARRRILAEAGCVRRNVRGVRAARAVS